MNILRKLRIFGWDKIEDFLLASIVTGDGLLLVGSHGTAKTYCAEIIAKSMGVKYQKVDASKAEFEDYLGFPNPRALSEGKFEYVNTPLTITDKQFVFIDEINRCKSHTQNKLLELIYSRQFFGQKTDVTWVWAAMNAGDEYTGIEPLDPAFIGRFAFIIPVPDAVDMEYDDVLKICLSHTHNDAPAIKKFWKHEKEQPITSDENYSLKPFFETAAKNYREIDKEMGELIGKILSTFTKIWWQERKDKIDGRRLSMMRRAVIAYLAVKKTKNKNFSITDEVFSLNLKNVIPYILPHLAAGKGLNPIHVEVALRAVFKTLAGTTPFIKAYFSPDLIVKMKTLCECDMPFFSRKKILSDVFKDKEMLPLVAFALLPFSLLRKSPFTRIERREIVKKVYQEQNSSVCQVQFASFNLLYIGPSSFRQVLIKSAYFLARISVFFSSTLENPLFKQALS